MVMLHIKKSIEYACEEFESLQSHYGIRKLQELSTIPSRKDINHGL